MGCSCNTLKVKETQRKVSSTKTVNNDNTDPTEKITYPTELSEKEQGLLSRKETIPNNQVLSTNGQILIEARMLVGKNTGKVLDSYRPEQKIGSGSFGKVYKVTHIPTGRFRAMKIVPKDAVQNQDDEKKFLKEIEILQNLDHPNILKIYEYFLDQSYFYVISEYLSGGELYEQILKLQFYNEKDAALIMKQLFSCVSYLHQNRIVHRDLKPENILLESKGADLYIKLIDFGSASYLAEGNRLNQTIGTPYYIAPEVLKNDYDHKCDLWSCGVIMYILLCGEPPFVGANDGDIKDHVLEGVYHFNSKEWNHISTDAKNLIGCLLQSEPKKRISAQDAIKHPWIVKQSNLIKSQLYPKLTLQDSLHTFSSKQKLQQASVAFIVHQMSNNKMIDTLREIFKQLDESGEGLISKDELKKGYMKFFKDPLSDRDFDELVRKLDQDNSGQISLEEFLRATLDYEIVCTEKNLELAFNFFDKDKSGKLSVDDVKEVLGVTRNDEASKKLIQEIIAEVDLNGDGQISFEEFKAMMRTNTKVK